MVPVARQNPSEYRISRVFASAEATPPHRDRGGWSILVRYRDYRGGFFAKGTYRKGKGRGQAGNPGVHPVDSLKRSGRVGRDRLLDALDRRLPG